MTGNHRLASIRSPKRGRMARGAGACLGRACCCVLAALACVPAVATGQDDITQSRRNAIVGAIETAAPAVVTISVVDIRTEHVYDPMFEEFYRNFGFFGAAPMVRRRAVEAVGTGFFIDDAGHILTNYHVIQGADYGTVTLPDGRVVDFEYVGGDERTDLAVLRAEGKDFPFVRLGNSDNLLVGEWVIAIGNPFGLLMRDPMPSVSVGVVSALHRRVRREVGGGDRLYQGMIQTDAAITPGNSGGPLVNATGEAIGVNTMIFSSSGGNEGLGFAIPMNRANRVARELIDYGRRRDPWLGFHGEAVNELKEYSLRRLGVQAESGVIVAEIRRDAPAYEAGLRLGDVIIEMNGEPVSHPADVDYLTWDLFVGDDVTLKADRQGQPLILRFKVKELAPLKS